MAFRNPLQWPIGKARTERRHKAPFSAKESTTITELDRSVRKLGLEDVQITTDRYVRVDGQISTSSAEAQKDPGIAIYFIRKGEPVTIAFDGFTDFWGNLRAIGLYLEYMARLESYDMAEMADQGFVGYKALPANTIVTPYQKQPWYDVLQVSQSADYGIVRSAYKNLVAKYHPDNQATGDVAMFHKIQDAWKESPHAN